MKHIILLSDGTGNSASALAKTNVWRVYQALDLRPPDATSPVQIAMFDDGVGTSSFTPLAILGGVFGWGLKRNVIELYEFLCRHYEPGDRIHAFGFSRGAFTIRTLVGLITSQGVAKASSAANQRRFSRNAYRAFRAKLNTRIGVSLVGPARAARDCVLRLWHDVTRHNIPKAEHRPDIAFVGVWDTVAAYGMPVAELTAGIDSVIWPLSMPNYRLSEKVERARHALALDDERDAFQPLPWDEVHERELVEEGKVAPDRLRQVWFAGVHADVGGGYADDGLAMIPLMWMIREAKAVGLRFRDDVVATYHAAQATAPPIHDSRKGLLGYYRYQPRRIDAWLETEVMANRSLRDLHDKIAARLLTVRVHHSVIARIQAGVGGYAPIVLPPEIEIVDAPAGTDRAATAKQRDPVAQEHVWNDVWRRRVNYYAMVTISCWLAAFPWFPASYNGSDPDDYLAVVEPLIRLAGSLVPAFLDPWIDAFARNPDLFTLGVAAIAILLARSARLRARIDDRMRAIWNGHAGEKGAERWSDRIIKQIRVSKNYQSTLRFVKWRFVPLVFGWLVLVLGAVVGPTYAFHVWSLGRAERDGTIGAKLAVAASAGLGTSACAAQSPENKHRLFRTCDPYWDTGMTVDAGERYHVTIRITEAWRDASIATTPEGFWTSKFDWWMRGAVLARRVGDAKWFQPVVAIDAGAGQNTKLVPLNMQPKSGAGNAFGAVFQASVSGRVRLFVNDAVIGVTGLTRDFYNNNRGAAEVRIEREQWSP